jgi:hypothetical protein
MSDDFFEHRSFVITVALKTSQEYGIQVSIFRGVVTEASDSISVFP